MKRTVTLLLLAAAGPLVATTPVPSPSATAGRPDRPWVVVQTDGSRVTFAAVPENRGGRLVGRIERSGALVSIPAARVDAEATARANQPSAALESRPKPVPTRYPFEPPALGDTVKLRKTGGEAQRVLEGARAASQPPTTVPGSTPGAKPIVEAAPHTDRSGRGEDYWRERASSLRSELRQAEDALAVAEADLAAAERANLGGSGSERTSFVIRVLEARDRAEKARLEQRQAAARWDALEEEARKAGAFPGWLR